jgi:spore maturation protein SpmB
LTAILLEALKGSAQSVFKVACIVIPLMVFIEFLKEGRLLDRIVHPLKPLMRFIGMSPAATFPLLVGIVFGLVYGSGLIIQSAQEGTLTRRDSYLLNIFLSVCHGMIEDTTLFLIIGASFGVIVFGRILAVLLITRLFAFLFSLHSPVDPSAST